MILPSYGFQNHAPQRRREAVFQKKRQKVSRNGCVQHERHKENNNLHKKFRKLQVLCIPSFFQTGLGGESCTGVELEAVFEGAWSEHIANRTSNLTTRAGNNYKICYLFCRLGVEKVILLIEGARSRFSEICFPQQREALF